MKKVLMVDNFDSFTFNLVQYFKRTGAYVETYRNNAGLTVVEKVKPQLIIISPGPSNPQNAGMSIAIIEKYAGKIPIFGVCLGMQAIAEAFGTRIHPLSIDEIIHGGTSEVEHDEKTIFTGIQQRFQGMRYHSLGAYRNEIAGELETSAITFAPETKKEIVMAIRHKKYPIEGVQFHPESVGTMNGNIGQKLIGNLARMYL